MRLRRALTLALRGDAAFTQVLDVEAAPARGASFAGGPLIVVKRAAQFPAAVTRWTLKKALMRSGLRRFRPLAALWRVLGLRAQRRYWRALKEEEGTLANHHFEYLFTTHFGLLPSFYAGKTMLDIGCGPRGSLEWATMAAERVGLDPLVETYRELGIADHAMRYVDGYAERMPFPDASFDVVSSCNSLDHVDDLDGAIAEIKRVLKPCGLFLLLTDVNHRPRLREPHDYSWEILRRFEPELRVVDERHFEDRGGVHASIVEGVPYDHASSMKRHGVLSAKLERI